MNITIKELSNENIFATIKMITEFMNYHRQLTNASKEYWQTDEQSVETLEDWLENGTVYNVFLDHEPVGFLYVRFGGQNVAWLEDIFIREEYRGKGIGRFVMEKLDDLMVQKNVVSLFVDVIPRKTSALNFYWECGFDHLNIIQLRKNYDEKLDKDEEIELLGFTFKKY